MSARLPVAALNVLLLLAAPLSARAQWLTQSILVKPGWTAIYLHVDPSYTSLDALVGSNPANPISAVWLWVPAISTVEYLTSPLTPLTGSSHWANWVRNGSGLSSALSRMVPNAAYLVHSLAATNYLWTIKGRPTPPNYRWTSSGINLIGFPTSPSSAPLLDSFLSLMPDFQSLADVYQYNGGELGLANPAVVFNPHGVQVTRGKAFWIRAGSYFNNYFGPFEVSIDSSGADFGDATSRTSFHLRNPTPVPVTVQLRLLPSETPPAGQTPVAGVPPLLVRGALNATNLTYSAANLTANNSITWTLPPKGQPDSDIIVVLGVNRVAFTNNPAGLYAGILKFTDAYNYTEVDVPVSALPTAYSGLWVGGASVSQAASYLKSYQRDVNNAPVLGANNAYVVTGVNTNLGATASAFPLRLIVHNDGSTVTLLQRVFFGQAASSNAILTTSESLLDPAQLGNARRLSAAQLPWTPDNQTWPFTGRLFPGATLTNTVAVTYDDQASNPFLHTYHPDHDNLDATFQNELPPGSESYGITRQMTLSINPPGDDFDSLTSYGESFQGAYYETISVTGISAAARTFNVAGTFGLTRISPIPVLTRP